MSAPAMNVRPAQTITMAWAAESEMACLRPSWRPCRTCWLSALTGGLLTVSTATRPRRSRSTDLVMAVMGLSSEVLAADGLYSYTMTTSTVEHGAQAIMPLNYGGPHGILAGGSMDLRFFHRLGATLLDRSPLCGGIRSEAWAGTYGAAAPGIPPEQIEHSKLIVAWGYNVTWSGLHMTPVIDRARRNGAKLVVVDPKRTKIAERADLHLPVKPGTDVVLAWAIAAELERRGGIDRAFVERHVAGYEEYMALARKWTPAAAAR